MSWPRVDMDDVSARWWETVMKTTSTQDFKNVFSDELDEASDFTIRAIVHIIQTKTREEVQWFLEGSQQQVRVIEIQDLLKSDLESNKNLGKEKLKQMVLEYTAYILNDD